MKTQLNAFAAALAVGVFWAVCLFLWTLIAAKNGYGQTSLDLIAQVYPGYEVTTRGAWIGLIWGFLDGFIGTYVVVWLYHVFVKKFGK